MKFFSIIYPPLPPFEIESRDKVIVCVPKSVLIEICAVFLSIEIDELRRDIDFSLALLILPDEITLHISKTID